MHQKQVDTQALRLLNLARKSCALLAARPRGAGEVDDHVLGLPKLSERRCHLERRRCERP